MSLEHWIECISSSLRDVGINATAEQIATIAENVEEWTTRRPVTCSDCVGLGSVSVRLTHPDTGEEYVSITTCPRCRGKGWHVL
jgi:DnaJ-class molecular chaperone